MPTALYRFRPKDAKKVRRWLDNQATDATPFIDDDIRRPQLTHLLAEIENGSFDRIVVVRLADMGMSALRLAAFLDDCRAKNVSVVSLTECFDLGTDNGKKLAIFLAHVAEGEREARDERQQDGIEQAKAAGQVWRGRPLGTRIAVTEAVEQKINDLFDAGTPVAEIAKDEGVGVSLRTVYRVLSQRDKGRS